MDARALILREAAGLGFVRVGVSALIEPAPRRAALDAWLARSEHGALTWMERGRADRVWPRRRLPDARSVVVLALEHHHRRPADPGGLTGKVARYAWGRDYHNLVGKRLRRLQRTLRAEGLACWGGVDTAAILERAWAEAAGVGFSGKNCLQIVPARGSWMFLAVLFVDAELRPDPVLGDHCGSCRRCLDACPTDAFPAPHRLDARRCISYWTIEARTAIPESLRPGFGRWVFGCDVCQEVCPHNAAPPDPEEDDLLPRNAWLDLEWVLSASDEGLLDALTGTPLRRPGAEGLRRNACVVLGNLGDPAAVPVLERAMDGSPLVREHAQWALGRLGAS